MSHGVASGGSDSSQAIASRRTSRACSPASFVARRFASIVRTAVASRSTKSAEAAPRDNASMPAAPLPANRSRNRAPRRSGSRIANSVCFTRSPSGRVPGPGAARRIARAEPAITRPAAGPDGPSGARRGLAGPHPGEPAVVQLVIEGFETVARPASFVEQGLGVRPRANRELAVLRTRERRDAEGRQAALIEAQHVALTPQLPVL